MDNFDLIDWKSNKRTFDVRVYIIQKDGMFIPVGGEGRVAKADYTGGLNKEEFVVNLTGYQGVDIERGIAFSEAGLKALDISKDDLVDMFCASCTLISCTRMISGSRRSCRACN